MATDIAAALAELKNRKASAADRFQSLKDNSEKQAFVKEKDERFWYPEVDKAGNAFAIIRFLDSPPGEDFPFVKKWSHGFQGPGGWYIENSLTTLGRQDPVSELNSILWKTGTEANKQIARDRKRRLEHYSNILVITDSKHPENEGKVFLFRYGTKIYDKINDKMNPEEGFEDEKPCNPFDFWTGANFKLKVRKLDGRTNYDKSEFETPSPLFGGDEDKIAAVWQQAYSLKELVSEKEFKTYDELKARLEKVLKTVQGGDTSVTDAALTGTEIDYETDKETKNATPSATARADDDDLDFFKSLTSNENAEQPF